MSAWMLGLSKWPNDVMNWLTNMQASRSHIIPGFPVCLTIGSISRIKPIFRRFIVTSIFLFPYFLIRNGANRFGQNEALPHSAVITAY